MVDTKGESWTSGVVTEVRSVLSSDAEAPDVCASDVVEEDSDAVVLSGGTCWRRASETAAAISN